MKNRWSSPEFRRQLTLSRPQPPPDGDRWRCGRESSILRGLNSVARNNAASSRGRRNFPNGGTSTRYIDLSCAVWAQIPTSLIKAKDHRRTFPEPHLRVINVMWTRHTREYHKYSFLSCSLSLSPSPPPHTHTLTHRGKVNSILQSIGANLLMKRLSLRWTTHHPLFVKSTFLLFSNRITKYLCPSS